VMLPWVVQAPDGSLTAVFTISTSTIASSITGPLTVSFNGSSQTVLLNLVAR
jgi:hypothetical protein